MPDLTLYRDDVEQRLIPALTVASVRYQKQGKVAFADELAELVNRLYDRLSQNLHPERPTQGESG